MEANLFFYTFFSKDGNRICEKVFLLGNEYDHADYATWNSADKTFTFKFLDMDTDETGNSWVDEFSQTVSMESLFDYLTERYETVSVDEVESWENGEVYYCNEALGIVDMNYLKSN